MLSKASRLRTLIETDAGPLVAAGAHDGVGALLADRAGFDAVWASGFEISAAHGLPDVGLLGLAEYLRAARVLDQACSLPVIADCDTGFGNELNVAHATREYESSGIAAICIEDKVFPKVNSFAGRRQLLVPVAEFQHKIEAAKQAQRQDDFMVIARTEALIAGAPLEEALLRAHAYAEAGADAILIHSKAPTAYEVEAFAREWRGRLPVVVVPTTYYDWTVQAAAHAGIALVIYANQGLRASVSAMTQVLERIREQGTSSAVESEIASMKDIFELQRLDEWLSLER